MIRAPRILVLTLTWVVTPLAGQAPPLDGDSSAVAAVQRMLARLGGTAAWAGARTIAVDLRGHIASDVEPWSERYWIDLEVPQGRYEIQAGTTRRVIAWTLAEGWESRDGVVESQSAERHALEQAYWRSELTVLFRRLASGMPRTRVSLGSAGASLRTLVVRDAASGDSIASLALNVADDPVHWSARVTSRTFNRILGPLEDYGGIRLPRWGATPDGFWRYEHVRVSLSPDPPPVSFDRPR